MGLHSLTLALVLLMATAAAIEGQQDTCRAFNETCGSQPSTLCCNQLQCRSTSSPTAQLCASCGNSVCVGADGLGICCAQGFICITGFGCCPIDQSCETAGPNSQLTCCAPGTTCMDPATNTGPGVCVDCPTSRTCELQSASGALVKRCCPEGYVCDPVNHQCKAACPPPLQPCNTPASDYCCPQDTYCSYTWPPSSPATEACCKKSQLCFNPAVYKPFCCPADKPCYNGKCQDCPTGTVFCPSSGTCCKADGSELCINSQCCPKARVCGTAAQPICCPPGFGCSTDGTCKEITPPPCNTTLGLYQCWLNTTTYVCCNNGTNCIPPPLGATSDAACCDPSQTCLDFPSMTSKVCCGRPQQCLNMLWPSPGSVSADQTCCPQSNQCKWLDTTVSPPKPGKDVFCCATICTPFNPQDPTSDNICCPKERYYEMPSSTGATGVQKLCCPPGSVYQPPAAGGVGRCVPVTPPCLDPTPQVCPLGVPPNGTTICCAQGTCYGGNIGCCKDKVCPVWPGTDPDNFKCCAAPDQCLPTLYPSSTGDTVGATPSCCPGDRICSDLTANGASKEQYCCSTFCTPNYPFQGALINICCPKDRVCGRNNCCPPGVPCIDGQCCPDKYQCLDPITGQKICCREGRCTTDWVTGQSICCGQPGSSTTICLAPSFPFKRTCCPSGFVCMSDGTCCSKQSFCVDPLTGKGTCCKDNQSCFNGICCSTQSVCIDPLTGKGTCCKDNQSCVNGICCDQASSDVCTVWPNLTGQQCCPKGDCLMAWSANPAPGGPVIPIVKTCCPQAHSCKPYLPTTATKGNICCMEDCLPLAAPTAKRVCCPKEKTCQQVNADGTTTTTCCKDQQICKNGKCCDKKNICRPYKPMSGDQTICCNKPAACVTLFGTKLSVCCSVKKQCPGQNNQLVCCKSNQHCQAVPGTTFKRCVP